MNYERIISACIAAPWAITPEKLAVIEAFLTRKARGETIPDAEIQAIMASKPKQKKAPPKVGIIGIYGTIVQRADSFEAWSGGTSTDAVGMQLDAFAADPSITAIILDVDSPGGSVYGVAELADKLYATAKVKKCIACVNSEAASAAYWIASNASEVVISPNGQCGSIGVYVMHVDRSAFDPAIKEAVTFIKAGERKTSGNPYGPLDEIGRAELQTSVDDYYSKFVKSVARGRNVSQATVRDGFGSGGMLRSEAALREGMADKIATFEDVLGRYGLSASDIQPMDAENDQPPPLASESLVKEPLVKVDDVKKKQWELEKRKRLLRFD